MVRLRHLAGADQAKVFHVKAAGAELHWKGYWGQRVSPEEAGLVRFVGERCHQRDPNVEGLDVAR